MDAEIKNFKKIKKVLKDALTTEKDKNSTLEKEIEKLKTRSTEMEAEIKEKEQKYLDLYMENTQQHE
jgi:cell division protein FtsB